MLVPTSYGGRKLICTIVVTVVITSEAPLSTTRFDVLRIPEGPDAGASVMKTSAQSVAENC
jgi:hypothetical protein